MTIVWGDGLEPVRADQVEPAQVLRHCGRLRAVTRRQWTDESLIFVAFQDGRWLECAPDKLLPRLPGPNEAPEHRLASPPGGGPAIGQREQPADQTVGRVDGVHHTLEVER